VLGAVLWWQWGRSQGPREDDNAQLVFHMFGEKGIDIRAVVYLPHTGDSMIEDTTLQGGWERVILCVGGFVKSGEVATVLLTTNGCVSLRRAWAMNGLGEHVEFNMWKRSEGNWNGQFRIPLP